MTTRWTRIRGLTTLVGEAVEHGSRAVEEVHRATARRPFAILELVRPIETPVRAIEAIHSVSLTGVYGSIRLVNRVVGVASTIAMDVLEARERARGEAAVERDGSGESAHEES